MTRRPGLLAGFVILALGTALPGCGPKRTPEIAKRPADEGASSRRVPVPTQTLDPGPDVVSVPEDAAAGTYLGFEEGEGGPLADIHFEFDQASLTEAARRTLEGHATWLQTRRDTRIVIEGHCDERGTVDYNLALGERRAQAAREYLVSLGVAPERITTISYGKERPLDPGRDESAWGRNRRCHFVVSR